MDEPQIDDLCPQCGSAVDGPTHQCADSATPRITIPPGLLDTGLFKTVGVRPPTGPSVSGSLLRRPEGLPSADEPTDVGEQTEDTEPAAEVEQTEATEPAAEVEASPESGESGEAEEITEVAEVGESAEAGEATEVAEASESGEATEVAEQPVIDSSLVVPAFLIAAAEGRVDDESHSAEEPADEPTPEEPAAEETPAEEPATDESAGEEPDTVIPAVEVIPTIEVPDAEFQPGDPEAARAALTAILYPDLAGEAEQDTPSEPAEAPTEPAPGVDVPEVPDAPEAPVPPLAPPARTSLASLRHQDADDYDEDDEDHRPRRRLALIGIGALVILLAAAGGGWAWWQHQQDAPVRDAFATSHGGFLTVVQELTEASTLQDVADVGTAFGELADDFDKTTEAADGATSDVAVAARRATLAEREVATAGASLADLGPDNFSPWLEVRGSLTSALEGLEAVRPDVAKAGGKANDLPDADLAEQVAGLIGSQASELAVDKTDLMLADLGKAKLVADLRAGGTDAAGSADALRTVAAGVEADGDTDTLVQHTELHAQLGKLANLRPNNLARWDAIRDRLIARVEFLPDEGAAAKESIADADRTLTKAARTWRTWQRETAAAKEAKESEEEALDQIENALERVSTDYDALNSSLGALITRGDTLESNGLEGDAYARLTGAADARVRLRNSLTALDVPSSVRTELNAVTSALDASARSARAAAESAGQCADECVLTDTSGWNDMARTRIGQATRFAAAVDAMTPAIAEAREAIADRELPERPKI